MKKLSLILILFASIYSISCTPSSKEVQKNNSTNNDSSITSGVTFNRINPYSNKRYTIKFSNLPTGGVATEILDSNQSKIYYHNYNLPLIPIPQNAISVGGSTPIIEWISSNQLLIMAMSSLLVNNVQVYPKYELLSVVDIVQKTNTDKIISCTNANDSDIAYVPIPWYNNSVLVPIHIGNTNVLVSYDYSFNVLNTTYNADLNSVLDILSGKDIPLSYSSYIDYYYFPNTIVKSNLNGQRDWGTNILINKVPSNVQNLDSLNSQIVQNTVVLKAKYTLNNGKDTATNFVLDTATGKLITPL